MASERLFFFFCSETGSWGPVCVVYRPRFFLKLLTQDPSLSARAVFLPRGGGFFSPLQIRVSASLPPGRRTDRVKGVVFCKKPRKAFPFLEV